MTPFGLVVSLSACGALLLSMHVCREGQGLCMISLLVCVCVCVRVRACMLQFVRVSLQVYHLVCVAVFVCMYLRN